MKLFKKRRKKRIGFSNKLAILIMIFLAIGIVFGFILAVMSIKHDYTGQLICWTAIYSTVGTATSICLSRIVDKSRAENVSADGTGIKYATAEANNFKEEEIDYNSPEI